MINVFIDAKLVCLYSVLLLKQRIKYLRPPPPIIQAEKLFMLQFFWVYVMQQKITQGKFLWSNCTFFQSFKSKMFSRNTRIT